jgi:hypothetical protein
VWLLHLNVKSDPPLAAILISVVISFLVFVEIVAAQQLRPIKPMDACRLRISQRIEIKLPVTLHRKFVRPGGPGSPVS